MIFSPEIEADEKCSAFAATFDRLSERKSFATSAAFFRSTPPRLRRAPLDRGVRGSLFAIGRVTSKSGHLVLMSRDFGTGKKVLPTRLAVSYSFFALFLDVKPHLRRSCRVASITR